MSETWETRPALPATHGLYAAGCGRDDRYFHVIGGDGALRRHDIFDEWTKTWDHVSDLPTDHKRHRAEAVDGKVYIFSPEADANSMIAYDPDLDTYTTKTDIPVSLSDRASFVIDDVIYIAGGYTGTTESKRFDTYRPATNTYTQKADLPDTVRLASATVWEGLGVVVGGHRGITEIAEAVVYDPVANTWSAMSDMPTARHRPAVGGDGPFVWAAVGVTGGSATAEVERLDMTTDTWTSLADAPFLVLYPAYGTVEGGIHVAQSATHYRFDAFETVNEGWGILV